MENQRNSPRKSLKIASSASMEAKSYSAREAARLAGVSIDTLKQMCRRGQLPHFCTPGGHLRIPAEGLKNLAEKPQGGAGSSTPSAVLQNRRERVEEVNLEVQEVRAQRELRKLRHEEAAEAEQRRVEDEARQQESHRRAQAAEQDRIDRLNREAEERRRQAELQRVADFRRRWLNVAERKADGVGWLSAQGRKLLLDALELEINKRGPADEAGMEAVLNRTVKAVVEPWQSELRRQQEEREAVARREGLVQRAVQLLFGATDADKIRATRALRSALEELPTCASDVELSTTVEEAVAPTKQAIEERQTRAHREQLIEGAGARLSWNSTAADKVQAAAAVRTALANLPLQASQSEEQTVVAAAIAPIEQAIRKGIEEKGERERLERNKASLVSLGVFHVGMYIERLYDEEEIDYAAYSDEEWKAELQAAVRRRLERELTGEEEFDEVQKLVRRIIDDELDEDAES